MIDLNGRKLILASGSPRRNELLNSFQIPFSVHPSDKEEIYPDSLSYDQVPEFLAVLKTEDIFNQQTDPCIVIGADTIVVMNGTILGKPKDTNEAFDMLSNLANTSHDVYTGVCLMTLNKKRTFTSHTKIYFSELSNDEIKRYVEECQPLDKAGAYGIQDWIGREKIRKIEGDYFNVMGFPISSIWIELKKLALN